jgi:hypothetical protein
VASEAAQYSWRVAGGSGRGWFEADNLRRVFPILSLAFAVVAAMTQPSSAVDLALAAVPTSSVTALARVVLAEGR